MVTTTRGIEIMKEGKISAKAIEDINKVNALTDRVKFRKTECLNAKPHLCAERSRLATLSWKETEGQPLVLRRARLFQKIMEGMSVSIWKDELIVGSQTKYLRGGAPAIDYSTNSTRATLDAEKLTIQGEVKEGIVTEEERKSLEEDANYWTGKAPGDVLKKMVLEKIPFPFEDYMDAHMFSDAPFAWPAAGRSIEYSRIMEKALMASVSILMKLWENWILPNGVIGRNMNFYKPGLFVAML